MIADAIREAQSEQEVFHLLNAYFEAVGCGGKPSYLLEDAATRPSCVNEVLKRCLELIDELDVAFGNALHRLNLLERKKHRSLAGCDCGVATVSIQRVEERADSL